MESPAIMHVCASNNVDCLVVRSVSDLAGGEPPTPRTSSSLINELRASSGTSFSNNAPKYCEFCTKTFLRCPKTVPEHVQWTMDHVPARLVGGNKHIDSCFVQQGSNEDRSPRVRVLHPGSGRLLAVFPLLVVLQRLGSNRETREYHYMQSRCRVLNCMLLKHCLTVASGFCRVLTSVSRLLIVTCINLS